MKTKITITQQQITQLREASRETFETLINAIPCEVDITLPKTIAELKRLRDNRRLTYTENYTRFKNTVEQQALLAQADIPQAEKETWQTQLQADLEKYARKCVEYLKVYTLAVEKINQLGGGTRQTKKDFFQALKQRAQ
jgi:hypothetical protein